MESTETSIDALNYGVFRAFGDVSAEGFRRGGRAGWPG
jgi:hypothetical protein